MIKESIIKLSRGRNLTFGETKDVFGDIFDSGATQAQIAAFLVSLASKGETEDEIAAAASFVRSKAVKVNARAHLAGVVDVDEPIIDTCGTGGSGVNKFNISTAVSFVVSSSGIKVAKHGNRAMSSSCGSADVLQALDINIDMSPKVMEESLKKIGIGFFFAPLYHPALALVAKIRREIGIWTVFNILGPLCNPAGANFQLLGVYSRDLVYVISRVLKKLGAKRALVVHGEGTGDEISLTGKTYAAYLKGSKIENLVLKPSDFGLKKINIKDIAVKDASDSARIVKEVLEGKSGAPADMVLAASGACFYILGKAGDFKEGVKMARGLIGRGRAREKLGEFRTFLKTAVNSLSDA